MTLSIPSPSEKQRQFLTDTHKYVAYGGARGGGKSWAVRTKAVLLCLAHPGIKVLIVRTTYPELEANHILPLQKELAGVAVYRDRRKMFTFPGGSTIKFGYCASDADTDRYQGAEYDVIFIDEATQLAEGWLQRISACCRGVNAFPKRIYYTCNPGGRSHHYIKRLFIDRCYYEGEDPADYSFIEALPTDNPALMAAQPDYIDRLKALPPKLRDAWLYGRWDVFSGQFFEEFRDDPAHYADGRYTHVIDPLPERRIRAMTIWRSYDFGYNKPFSCGWWGIDEDGVLYRLLELYGCTESADTGVKWTPERQFAEIRRIEDTHPWLAGRQIFGVADPAIWNASTGKSIAEVAEEHGVYFERGDNRRIPGWMQLRHRLRFDQEGRAGLYVFRGCRAFIRTLPLLQYSDTCPEDLDTTGEDHVADETRYMCMARPVAPRTPEGPPVLSFGDPLGR